MKNYSVKNVDEYIASASKDAQSKLREIRAIIKSAVPGAEEGISWGFPLYKYHGILTHFAEYKHHVALGFGSDIQDSDCKTLEKEGYATGQKRIQIKFDQKVPIAEIKKILKAQAKINVAKMAKK